MKNSTYTLQPDDNINELRLVTRSLLLLALLTAILYIRVFLTSTLSELDTSGYGELGPLSLLFLIAATVGLLLAWHWEGLGGLVVVISGIALTILNFISASQTPWITAFFYGSPFLITGAVSLFYWWRKA
jgi:hypothetical protein